MKLRRLRDGDVLENGDIVVIRGGDLDPDILRADAARYYSIYGAYGISVFAVLDVTVDELAQQVPLVRFDRPSLLRVRDVLAAGIRRRREDAVSHYKNKAAARKRMGGPANPGASG